MQGVAKDRLRGRPGREIARAFHAGVAAGLVDASTALCGAHSLDTVVVSGGVFQNDLLLGDVRDGLAAVGLRLWTNHQVPPNDGGLSLGQAALCAMFRHPEGDLMHELSIAMSIVDMASEEAERHGSPRVDAVHLRLGRLSGVVAEALLASYDLACEQTALEGSRY